ncbi:FMN-binding negative transcriptional regulator [Stutzerimonas azotifigens]|uniref:FMN-binding negative transcriptional regulator n=1 Tax=Stutzerimonas azotifigens TaxID=291995 RepID=UPI0004013459|nr:FMN-binding negative transcriptional regulator [Stutzerimonas azotifigens]
MYLPSTFRQDDLPTLHAHIERTGLATLITHGAQGLQASPLPLVLARDEGPFGTLYGHFARANPQWRDLADGEALVLFTGPDAYVSPSFYPSKAEHGRVVPTWNYLSVQARGRAETIEEPQRLLALLRRLSDRHEAGRPQPWRVEDAPRDFLDSQLRAIVGFAMPIARLEGKWKLSQNRREADRQGVIQGLAASGSPGDAAVAARMIDPSG